MGLVKIVLTLVGVLVLAIVGIAAYLYLPALIVMVLGVSSLHASPLLGFAAAGVLLVAFLVYAMIGEWR